MSFGLENLRAKQVTPAYVELLRAKGLPVPDIEGAAESKPEPAKTSTGTSRGEYRKLLGEASSDLPSNDAPTAPTKTPFMARLGVLTNPSRSMRERAEAGLSVTGALASMTHGLPFAHLFEAVDGMAQKVNEILLVQTNKQVYGDAVSVAKSNRGINEYNISQLDSDPVLRAAASTFITRIREVDEKYRASFSRPIQGLGDERDIRFGDPSFSDFAAKNGIDLRADLIRTVRASLPHPLGNDADAVLLYVGKIILLFHDNIDTAAREAPDYTLNRETKELIDRLPLGVSAATSDWLASMLPQRTELNEKKGEILALVNDTWGQYTPGGRVREGYYHLNGAVGVYLQVTHGAHGFLKKMFSRAQARLGATYKATSSDAYRMGVGRVAHELLVAKAPDVYARAKNGTFSLDDVMRVLAAQVEDPTTIAAVAKRGNCSEKEATKALRNELLLIFHSYTAVDFHRGARSVAVQLRRQIKAAIREDRVRS